MLTKYSLILTFFTILNRDPLSYLFHNYSVILGGIFAFICLFTITLDLLKRGLIIRLHRLNIVDELVYLYVFYLLVRALFSLDTARSCIGLILYLGFIPIYVAARISDIEVDKIQLGIISAFAYLTFFAFIQSFFSLSFGLMPVYSSLVPYFPMRVTSTLGSSLHFGAVYTALIITLTSWLATKRSIANYIALIALNLVGLFLILGTSSRGAFVMYVCSLLFLLLNIKNKRVKVLLPSVFLIIIIFAYLKYPDYFVGFAQRITSIIDLEEASSVGRIYRYKIIASLLGENPLWILFGSGLGYTGNIVKLFGMESIFKTTGLAGYATESYLLKLLLETGPIGLVLWYSIILITIKRSITSFHKESSSTNTWLYLGIASSLIGFCIYSFTLQLFEIPGVAFLTWFYIGFISKETRNVKNHGLSRKLSRTFRYS